MCTEDFHKAYKFNLTGEGGMVRERAALYALDLIRRCALGIIDKEAEYFGDKLIGDGKPISY